jgi:thiamine-phosphate pyrophosphorylase
MTMSVLRLIDVNANRSREALRVLEDYARFVLDSDPLCGALKSLRHELTSALAAVLPDAVHHRDTAGDVGTALKTDAELSRSGLDQVVIAAGKRLGESLRSLEEYLKIEHPVASRTVEDCRYRFYDLERSLLATLRPHHSALETAQLYVLITESACALPWLDVARAALDGGAQLLQLREKSLDSGPLLHRAQTLVNLARPYKVPVIINDRPDIALLSHAAGVHLGQSDLPPAAARKLLGNAALIGVSTHQLSHAHRARIEGADYIGAGPVFRSPTKPRDIDPGLPYLQSLVEYTLPVFAIAGITLDNLPEVLASGARRIAVTAAVTQSPDPAGVCRAFRSRLNP